MVLDRLDACSGLTELCIMDAAPDRVLAARYVLCIHQKAKTVFKG